MTDGKYAKIPASVLADPTLTDAEARLIGYLAPTVLRLSAGSPSSSQSAGDGEG
jgi:hypothetical protein